MIWRWRWRWRWQGEPTERARGDAYILLPEAARGSRAGIRSSRNRHLTNWWGFLRNPDNAWKPEDTRPFIGTANPCESHSFDDSAIRRWHDGSQGMRAACDGNDSGNEDQSLIESLARLEGHGSENTGHIEVSWPNVRTPRLMVHGRWSMVEKSSKDSFRGLPLSSLDPPGCSGGWASSLGWEIMSLLNASLIGFIDSYAGRKYMAITNAMLGGQIFSRIIIRHRMDGWTHESGISWQTPDGCHPVVPAFPISLLKKWPWGFDTIKCSRKKYSVIVIVAWTDWGGPKHRLFCWVRRVQVSP